MKHDAILLDHILDAINQIEEYTNGIDREEFLETRMV